MPLSLHQIFVMNTIIEQPNGCQMRHFINSIRNKLSLKVGFKYLTQLLIPANFYHISFIFKRSIVCDRSSY